MTAPARQATFDVDAPGAPRNRLTTALRLFTTIPVAIVLCTIQGLLVLPPLLMLVFREKYPRWWYDFNVELLRFSARVGAYAALLTDDYPSTDEQQAVRLELPEPDPAQLNRWLPLVKWLLVLPHLVVLAFLWLGAIVAVIASWAAIVVSGRHPAALYDYVVGVGRWSVRVAAYAFVLVTDEYPPFRLAA